MAMPSFTVRRRDPELIGPARPTPRETKRLSDFDDQEGLRHLVPNIFFYRGGSRVNDDPARVIRRALAEALVPYYPLAGRLREVEGRKLVVDCTGEGVLFLEADADVRLAELEAANGGLMAPPFPCFDELLFDVPGSYGIVNCPLLLIQVTRLLCGGFAMAVRLNHAMCDAIGLAQFLSAVADLARGLPAPTVAPAWSRELMDARSPPAPSFPHHEYGAAVPMPPPAAGEVMRTFAFGAADVAAIKRALPPRLAATTTSFEAVTAALWRARTAALELPPDDVVRLAILVNVRGVPRLGLPAGYYGNAVLNPVVTTTAGALRRGSLADAVALVRAAKPKASDTAEFVRSTADFLVQRGRPNLELTNLFLLSDTRRTGFRSVDLGWGEPVYGGPAGALLRVTYLLAVGNDGGADARLAVPIVLPRQAMDRFASEVDAMLTCAAAPAPRHSRL